MMPSCFPSLGRRPAVKNQMLVADDMSVETADLRASMGVTDTVNAAPTTPGDLALDELRRALDIADT
jgi:hypothetical protein